MNMSKFSSLRKLALTAALASAGLLAATGAQATATASVAISKITVTLVDTDTTDAVTPSVTFNDGVSNLTESQVEAYTLPTQFFSGNWTGPNLLKALTFSLTANTQMIFDVQYTITAAAGVAGDTSSMKIATTFSGFDGDGLAQSSTAQDTVKKLSGTGSQIHSLYTLSNIFNNYSDNATSGNKLRLSTTGVGTSVVSSVPEPESYAMFLAGLAAMGAVARRRRVK